MYYQASLSLLIIACLLLGCARERNSIGYSEAAPTEQQSAPVRLAPFVPSPIGVVETMLELAGVTEKDVVYDLGAGDGRMVITAAKKYGARAVGFEINPDLVKRARKAAEEAGVAHLVEIRQQDMTTADVSEATVVTLFLYKEVNMLLQPILVQQLPRGARVVTSQFGLGDWKPDAYADVTIADDSEEDPYWIDVLLGDYTIYLYRIDNHR